MVCVSIWRKYINYQKSSQVLDVIGCSCQLLLDCCQDSEGLFTAVEKVSGLLVNNHVVLQLFLHFLVFPLGLHNLHENLVNLLIKDLVVSRQALVLVA